MTTNPTVIKFCNEQVRPDAQRIRAAYARGIDFAARMKSTITPILAGEGLIAVDPNTGAIAPTDGNATAIIEDGREAREGVAPITIAEFCLLANTFGGLTIAITGDEPFIAALSKACVLALEAGG